MKKFIKKKLYGGKLNEDRIPKIKRIIVIKNLLCRNGINLKIELFKY